MHKLLRNACRDWKLKGGNPRRHDAELLLEPRLQPIECRSGCSTHCEGCERVKVCPPPRGCSALLQVSAPRNLSRLHTTMLLRTCDRHSLPGHNQMMSISLLSAASTASTSRPVPPFSAVLHIAGAVGPPRNSPRLFHSIPASFLSDQYCPATLPWRLGLGPVWASATNSPNNPWILRPDTAHVRHREAAIAGSDSGWGMRRYYGGSRFDSGAVVGEEWSHFGGHFFLLPRLELVSSTRGSGNGVGEVRCPTDCLCRCAYSDGFRRGWLGECLDLTVSSHRCRGICAGNAGFILKSLSRPRVLRGIPVS